MVASGRKPISVYCRQNVLGWHRLSSDILCCPHGEEQFTCGFIRPDGVQMIASIKNYNVLTNIHVTVAPVYSMRPELTKDEMEEYLFEVTPEVVRTFFGNRQFARAPDDPRKPDAKHYFAVLEAHE